MFLISCYCNCLWWYPGALWPITLPYLHRWLHISVNDNCNFVSVRFGVRFDVRFGVSLVMTFDVTFGVRFDVRFDVTFGVDLMWHLVGDLMWHFVWDLVWLWCDIFMWHLVWDLVWHLVWHWDDSLCYIQWDRWLTDSASLSMTDNYTPHPAGQNDHRRWGGWGEGGG